MYKSTRQLGKTKEISSSLAIIKGMAEDGGLFVCDKLPSVWSLLA